MKNSRYVLLIIGILGVTASIYGMIMGDSLVEGIIPLVCGASLIFGYIEMSKKQKEE